MTHRIYFWMLFLSFTLFCTTFLARAGDEPIGSIHGTVVNADTKEPIFGVNVFLLNTSLGTTTDTAGQFVIPRVPAGSYNLSFQNIGFETVVQSDIIVRPDRIAYLNARMRERLIETKETVIKADYFSNDDTKPLSLVSFNAEEIRRAPGAAGDVSRILSALPGLSQVADNSNDLMVRGGSPTENGFFVDGIQIPNINHFPVEGSTGGPIGIINVDFLEDVSFLTGGFSAEYGNRLSSIVDMKFRDGNREAFDTQIDMGMEGLGGVIEGPLPDKKGSWFLSARRSYLDFIVKAIGTGVAPRYGDIHAKVTYDLDSKNRISILDIYGWSTMDRNQQESLDSHEPQFGHSLTSQNSAGATWRSLWGDKGYSTTSLSYSFIHGDDDWSDVASGSPIVSNIHTEGNIYFRNINYLQCNKWLKFEGGIDAEKDLADYDETIYPFINNRGQSINTITDLINFSTSHYGGFLNTIWNPFSQWTLTLGLRGDYSSFNNRFALSPRILSHWEITPRFAINGSFGLFLQEPPLLLLSQTKKMEDLSTIQAHHYVAGLEYLVTADAKMTLEVYDKEYNYLPLDPTNPTNSVIDDGRMMEEHFRYYENLLSTGKAYARGIEFLLQKKLAKDFYGLISTSLFRCRYQDYNGTWHDRIYDNQYLFSVIGGYKPDNNWEFSIRWEIAGGVPYTPIDIQKSTAMNELILDQTKINGARYPDYHSLNLRVDRKFYFEHSSLSVYINLENAYNKKNVWMYYWDKVDHQVRTMYQWGFLPIGGFEFEF